MSFPIHPPNAPSLSGRRSRRSLRRSRRSQRAFVVDAPELFRPKLFSCIDRDYWRGQFSRDVMAGVIVGIVALPLAIAFAVASGVSPEKGLVTAVVAGFLVSFLGGSRVQIGGPTGAYIVIVLGIKARYGMEGLAISTILAGAMLIGFGLLRLGAVIKFIPHPVIVGFTGGIALTIFTTQVSDALGLPPNADAAGFVGQWTYCLGRPDLINGWSLALAAAAIGLTGWGRYFLGRIPGSLAAIVATTLAASLFDLPVATIQKTFGDIPTGLALSVPKLDFSRLADYIQPAFAIAMLGAIESLLSAVVADGMIGGNHRSNTELVAQGVANIVTPLFGGIPATGAIARTATNVKNGGRTPVAGIVHAATLLLVMLVFGRYAQLIPMPCLAGILIVVSYNMSEWRSFRSILGGASQESAILLATFLLTVLVDLIAAIEIGMVLAAFLFIQRMAKLSTVFKPAGADGAPDADAIEDYSKLPPGVDVFEISGPFFFAAARRYQEVLRNIGKTSRFVVIRMRHVPFIDSTGMRNFKDVVAFMRARHKTVILSGVRDHVLRSLIQDGLASLVGRDHIFPTFDEALAGIRLQLDQEQARNETSGPAETSDFNEIV